MNNLTQLMLWYRILAMVPFRYCKVHAVSFCFWFSLALKLRTEKMSCKETLQGSKYIHNSLSYIQPRRSNISQEIKRSLKLLAICKCTLSTAFWISWAKNKFTFTISTSKLDLFNHRLHFRSRRTISMGFASYSISRVI